jgi:hypothetical protein
MALLDLNAQTTSRLGLEPIKDAQGKYLYNGCIPAVITNIHVNTQKHTKGEFANMDVPVLQVEFENLKLTSDEVDRFYTHSFKVVGSKQLVANTTDQYEDRKELDILNDTTDLWKGIKHLLESLSGSPNYRNIINISKTDFTKYFDLPGLGAAADRLTAYQLFFDYIVAFVKGDDKDIKSQIVGADGKPLPIWIKMLPNYDKDPKRNAKYYAISRFINQGVFEPLVLNKGVVVPPKVIRVKPSESLELIKTAPIPGVNTAFENGAGLGQGLDPTVARLLQGGR